MSASNPHGGQKFAFNGQPFSGVQFLPSTSGVKYGFNGLPVSALYPPSNATFAISSASAFAPRWANPSPFTAAGSASLSMRGTLPARFAASGSSSTSFIAEPSPRSTIYEPMGLSTGEVTASVAATIAPIAADAAPGVLGAISLPAAPSPLGLTGAVIHTPFDFFYNRIWIVPASLTPINPRLHTNIPFGIFNAYEAANTLATITPVGATGLTLDISAPSAFGALEMRTVNVQIDETAPMSVDATFTFAFSTGSGVLNFAATVSDFVVMLPDDGVVETWGWLTNVMVSQDGEEQRVALRTTPRRSLEFSFLLDQPERRAQYRRWHRSVGFRTYVPLYWYAARITAAVSGGATRIYFDPAKTDVRAGESIVVVDPLAYTGQLAVISTMETDGATLTGPIAGAVTADMLVCPALSCRFIDGTGLSMTHVTGTAKFKFETMVPRAAFARPGAAPVIATFDGYDILDRMPVSRGENDETFQVSYELFDGDTGITDLDQAWLHPRVLMPRVFRIPRERDPGEMDFWRNFLDARKGQHAAFLASTWQPDLVLTSPPDGSNVLTLTESYYVTELFPYGTYKRLALTSAAGVAAVKVDSATANPDGTATLHLTAPYGATSDERNVSMVSFLNLVRLGEDSVKLTHDQVYSTLEMKLRTVDA